MTSDLDSIDSELSALRRELDENPNDRAKQRVVSRLERSLPLLAMPVAAPPTPGINAPAPGRALRFASPSMLGLVGAFVLGGGFGAATYAALEAEPPPSIVVVERAVALPAVPVEPTVSSAPDAVPSTEAAPRAALASRRPAPSAAPRPKLLPAASAAAVPAAPPRVTDAASLAEQQALLDEARAALGKDDGRGALDLLGAHTRRFPESLFAEERAALTVKALASAGRRAEARARLAEFAATFPRSPLLPSLRLVTRVSVTETER
jgi:hypothetical protein